MKFRRKWKPGGHPRRSFRPYHRYREKRLLNKPRIGYEAEEECVYEEELIALERDFWENHVLTKTPPPYVEADGDLILESLRRKLGPADKDAPPVLLGQTQFGQLSMLLSLQEQKKALSADVSKLDKDIKRLKGILASGSAAPGGL